MLATGLAALLLGVLGFSVSVAGSLRTRRTQSAVLAAMGVGRRAQAGQLCLEQLALSVPAAAAGLLAGIGLAWLVVPAVTLTAGAADPVPPDDSAAWPGRCPGPGHRRPASRRRCPVSRTKAGPGRAVAGGGQMRTPRRLRAAWMTLTGTGAAASVAFGLLAFASVLASLAIPGEYRLAYQCAPARGRGFAARRAGRHRDDRPDGSAGYSRPECGPRDGRDRRAPASGAAAAGLPIATDPPAWSGLTSGYAPVTGAARAAGHGQPQFEVAYRTALARYSHTVAGHLPSGGTVPGAGDAVQAAVTTATAARLGLRVGARLDMGPVMRLVITGTTPGGTPGFGLLGAYHPRRPGRR